MEAPLGPDLVGGPAPYYIYYYISYMYVCEILWFVETLHLSHVQELPYKPELFRHLKFLTLCRPRWLSWMRIRLVIRRLRFRPPLGRQHFFVEIDHEIFSTVILSLPLIQEGQ